jgi:hypothetical protein
MVLKNLQLLSMASREFGRKINRPDFLSKQQIPTPKVRINKPADLTNWRNSWHFEACISLSNNALYLDHRSFLR